MKQSSFTAEDLFGMAYLMRKRKTYGIPDAVGTDRSLLPTVLDRLIAQKIADMDIDGNITLRPEYADTVSIYCDCKKCLTLNVHTDDGKDRNFIFWLYDGRFFMAEFMDDRYVFSDTDADMVHAFVSSFMRTYNTEKASLPLTVIPEANIVKAKRECLKGDFTNAVRILRQSGVPAEISGTIVSGLSEKAYYFGLVYMDIQTGECQKQELSYIGDDGMLLSIGKTVANLRTCMTFIPAEDKEMHGATSYLLNIFSDKED